MIAAQPQTEFSTSLSPGEVEIILVPPVSLNERIEAEMRKHIEPAIEKSHGRILIDEVIEKVISGKMQLWFSMSDTECVGAAITHVTTWGSGKKSVGLLLAGGKDNMYRNTGPTMQKVEEFAELLGCSSVLVNGRKGWERALPEGYKFTNAVFEKEIA